jgi:cell division protein FtsA
MRTLIGGGRERQLVVGLDVGTSKVSVIVGELTLGEPIEVIGVGTQSSRGIKRGVVVDIESTVQAIQRAISEAEVMSGCEIRSVYAGIGGNHIRSLNSSGVVAVKEREIQPSDVDRVLDAAKALPIPADQKIIHVLAQEYLIDDQDGIRMPVGMSGTRLEAKVHIVTAANSAVQNMTKCVQRCGLQVDNLILQPLASSVSVLTEDEKDLGVMLVDLGAGTTNIAIWRGGALHHSSVIPLGGDQVTGDIAQALRTTTNSAEELKIKYACALAKLAAPEETIQVPGVGERESRRLSRQLLASVVQPRYDEILGLAHSELRRSGLEDLVPAGIVITGGGAKIEGAVEHAEEVFGMPVRLGLPTGVTGLSDVIANPAHAAGIGFLLFGAELYLREHSRVREPKTKAGAFFARMRQWFGGEF